MWYGYWIDALLGLILMVAPFVANFAQDHAALYTDVGMGILLLPWAIGSYFMPGGKDRRTRPSHA